MKVREVLAALEGLDPNMDVLCTIESLERPIEDGEIFEILDGSVVEAEKFRGMAGRAGLRYQRSELSEPHMIFEVTIDF